MPRDPASPDDLPRHFDEGALISVLTTEPLDRFLDYHHRQGLSPRRLALEELFHPATRESYSL